MRKKRFSSVADRQSNLPPLTQKVTQQRRKTITAIHPDIQESLTYNLCFYKYKWKLLCYLNNETKHKKTWHLTIGLCQWVKLIAQDPAWSSILEWDGKMVRKLIFHPDTIISPDIVIQAIKTSCEIIDETRK